MSEYSTSNGDDYQPIFMPKPQGFWWERRLRVRVLVSSIKDSLNRGSLDWNDKKSWNLLEASYAAIKRGE
jgi:hypothetical protein